MALKNGMNITLDKFKRILAGVKALPGKDVLVGIPGEMADRNGDPPGTPNNAVLGYVHEFGMPERNLPARPFLFPGIRHVQPRTASYLKQAGAAVLEGNPERAERALDAAGLIASTAAKNKISAGIPPPLAESTLRARARRKAGAGHRINLGAQDELNWRANGGTPGTTFAKPLIDTGQLLASITYVVRTGK